MKHLAWLALGLSLSAHAANITITTGVTQFFDSNDPSGSRTIDSGLNRKFVCRTLIRQEDADITTFTIGGQAPSEVFEFLYEDANDGYFWEGHWNEAAIAAMSGTAVSYSDNVSPFNNATLCFTIENTDQGDIDAGNDFTGTSSSTSASSRDVSTPNNTNDLVLCSHIAASGSGETLLSSAEWLTIHKGSLDADFGDTSWDASFASAVSDGNAAKDTTTLTFSRSDIVTAACTVFPHLGPTPSFSSGPTVAAAANGYTISGTLAGQVATVYAVGLNPGATPPADCDAVETLVTGMSAPLYASEAWSVGVPDSFALTAAGSWPRHDVYICAEGAGGDTSVTTAADQNRSPRSGYTITVTTSIHATSFLARQTATGCDSDGTTALLTGCAGLGWLIPGMRVDLSAGGVTDAIGECAAASDSQCGPEQVLLHGVVPTMQANITATEENGITPTPATGDVIEGANVDNQGRAITYGADGTISCATCSGYWTVALNVQDVSDASDGDFDTGFPEWSAGDLTVHVNSTRPTIDAVSLPFANIVLLFVGVPHSVSLIVTDIDGQAVTCSARTSPPPGMAISANAFTGTPTTEDEVDGFGFTVDCIDSGGLYATPAVVSGYTTDNAITVPDLTDGDLEDAQDDATAARPWLVESSGGLLVSFVCSDEMENTILFQEPEAMETIDADDFILLAIANGNACGRGGSRFKPSSPFKGAF